MAWIEGGAFSMGSDRHYPEEAPARRVRVGGFFIDRFAVTNSDFERFVAATGHITFAERRLDPADYPGAEPEALAPGSAVFTPPRHRVSNANAYQWWSHVIGANWRHPRGPASTIRKLMNHPVVHIALEDAEAYAIWAGKSLPTEAEWEFAARGGLDDAEFAWGDEFTPDGRHMANTWQGEFPRHNTCSDGFAWTSPVGSFPANGYGLHDMIGNVWEWTQDWYGPHTMPQRSCCTDNNPRGGAIESSLDPTMPAPLRKSRKVTKGGSFLCAPSYCRRYRPAARLAQPIDTSTCHVGFRCVSRASI